MILYVTCTCTMYIGRLFVHTVEAPIKDAPNKGHDSEHQKVTFLYIVPVHF